MAADSFDNFTPLTDSVPVGSLPEYAPLKLANSSWFQRTLADRNTQLAAGQSNSGNWDMITANETGAQAGRYLFSPFETSMAGVQRIDLQTGITHTLVNSGTKDFVSGDSSRWAPWGSYLMAEESWGAGSTKGRLFELTNPVTATGPADANFTQRNIIPHVAHEGLAFDNRNNLYFVDELNGGGIYKYVSAKPNAGNGNDYFAAGQTFVAKVGGGNNASAVGNVAWAPITNPSGGALAGSSVTLANGEIDGRLSADAVQATNYQRPEDMEMRTLPDGVQQLFFTTTTTHEVYSFDLASNTASVFADRNTIDLATGKAVGDAFTNPDNLAIDAKGNIYIVEDQPGGLADIWFANDSNHDGVAESLARWASLSTEGAEPTGLYFDKFDSNVAYLDVQHPLSGVDRTIVISAVPEPETYALFTAGLGMLGFIRRRRDRKPVAA
ncbi:MAG TPA: alkaline phosphatase PhoX [Methylophilaceae bacterium]|nr:alkaline phosphatase PhoX [Methylophilaceae bacterium]